MYEYIAHKTMKSDFNTVVMETSNDQLGNFAT